MKFFYTFGNTYSKHRPHRGGWAEIDAPSLEQAHQVFRKYFPDRIPGVLHCAGFYTEEEFRHTEMPERGNFGTGCCKKICVCPDCGSYLNYYQLCDCGFYFDAYRIEYPQ